VRPHGRMLALLGHADEQREYPFIGEDRKREADGRKRRERPDMDIGA
jgi:hypothetical protein